ncbi:putative colanic acid biosynthesis acetyltransferase [Coraliomargarita algicola]|uniref:Colanic acid biosynthesis acetyltransferase n=1 Tax=Coraliomargarita algicola TaxID=3092156 RepID=A0ABZ0RIL7_9BACT|nr:putative colanic acid biosynthesis acetyltransferase [Coraliomargarita sp. J2-16]WPJ95016.1 putative colanic acid biosynthesis acetyltransferase [Coraliomargarita sp. J2-16]
MKSQELNTPTYQSELTFKNKLGRLLWGIVYVFLFRPSPRVLHGWRCWLLNRFGARVASSAKIYPSARIWAPWNLEIGERAILGDRVDCYSVAPISIGMGAVVSQDACLCGATHNCDSAGFELIPKPIHIGPKAWVCARAFVTPGVTLAEGAVAGAAAVVTKDVTEWQIVGGNPARLIRSRARF